MVVGNAGDAGVDVLNSPLLVVCMSVSIGGHSEELLGMVPGTEQLNFAAVMYIIIMKMFTCGRLTDVDIGLSLDFEEKTATLW